MSATPPSEAEVRAYATTLSNKGRWGADDELGTLNLITPEKRVAAAKLVRLGRAISCAAPITKMQQAPDVPFPPLHFMIRSGESVAPSRPGTVDFVAMVFHGLTTTHVDALSHSILDGQLYGGRDPGVVTTEFGATQLSADAMRDGVATRGVLLDVPRALGREHLEPGEPVTPEVLERVEGAEGVRVGEGDALLLRTGWWRHRHAHGPAAGRARPGLHASALPWLRERGVAVLATDAANDVVPSGYELELPVHEIAQVAMGLCLVDVCDFDALAAACAEAGRHEVFFAFAPLRMPFATGSPVNPVALL